MRRDFAVETDVYVTVGKSLGRHNVIWRALCSECHVRIPKIRDHVVLKIGICAVTVLDYCHSRALVEYNLLGLCRPFARGSRRLVIANLEQCCHIQG